MFGTQQAISIQNAVTGRGGENSRMNSPGARWMHLATGPCALFAVLALAPAGLAQQAGASGPQVAAPASAAAAAAIPRTASPSSAVGGAAVIPVAAPAAIQETSASSKPGGEGITVHGHWVLIVKNPDGKQVERREFDNSLVTDGVALSGNQALAALLSGNATVGDPAILFIQSPSGSNPSAFCPANDFTFSNSTCWGLTTSETQEATLNPSNFFNGLNATVSFSPTVNWVLAGNFTVPSGLSSIAVVQTVLSLCLNQSASFLGANYTLTGSSSDRHADLPAKSCAGPLSGGGVTTSTPQDDIFAAVLTSTSVPGGPLAVTAGQTVQVSVTISFS